MEVSDFDTLDDIYQWRLDENPRCLTCGGDLGEMRVYTHTGGFRPNGRDWQVWVYFKCVKCGYQNAIWKLVQDEQARDWPKLRDRYVR